MKRPKGTKSRRWARGLPYAQREHPHRMHRILCPDTNAGTSTRVAGRISALCFGSPPVGKCLCRPIGVLIVRMAVCCQHEANGKPVDVCTVTWQELAERRPLPPAPSPGGRGGAEPAVGSRTKPWTISHGDKNSTKGNHRNAGDHKGCPYEYNRDAGDVGSAFYGITSRSYRTT